MSRSQWSSYARIHRTLSQSFDLPIYFLLPLGIAKLTWTFTNFQSPLRCRLRNQILTKSYMLIDIYTGVFSMLYSSQCRADSRHEINWETRSERRIHQHSTKRKSKKLWNFSILLLEKGVWNTSLSRTWYTQLTGEDSVRKSTQDPYPDSDTDALSRQYTRTPTQQHFQKTAMIHYDMTVAMLNDSMGLCLRWEA